MMPRRTPPGVEALDAKVLPSSVPALHGVLRGSLTVVADRHSVSIDRASTADLPPLRGFGIERGALMAGVVTVWDGSTPPVAEASGIFPLDEPKSGLPLAFVSLTAPDVKDGFTRSPVWFRYTAERFTESDAWGPVDPVSIGTGVAVLRAPGAFAHPGKSGPFTLEFYPDRPHGR